MSPGTGRGNAAGGTWADGADWLVEEGFDQRPFTVLPPNGLLNTLVRLGRQWPIIAFVARNVPLGVFHQCSMDCLRFRKAERGRDFLERAPGHAVFGVLSTKANEEGFVLHDIQNISRTSRDVKKPNAAGFAISGVTAT